MTAADVGIGVEDAYYAVHRKELHAAAMREAAEKTAEKLASAIRSGSRRPRESGASAQAPSVSTFDYAKATYDSAQKIITVKLENTGTSAYTQVRIEAKNGIKITDASIGDGINAKASVTVSSSGTSATLKNSNLLGAGKEGYIYLKYDGEIDPAKLPVLIRINTASGEKRVYTVFCDTSAANAEIGEPDFTEPAPETTEAETTTPETTVAPETEQIEQTAPAPVEEESKPSLLLPIALATAAVAGIACAIVLLKKKKK
jgi:hypothetical protein